MEIQCDFKYVSIIADNSPRLDICPSPQSAAWPRIPLHLSMLPMITEDYFIDYCLTPTREIVN